MDSTVIDVIVSDIEKNPHCFHGPTLLFKRIKGKAKEYYACSACRDRKDCNFFVLAEDLEKDSTSKISNYWKEQQKLALSNIAERKLYDEYARIISSLNFDFQSEKKGTNANYCFTCACLFTKSDSRHSKCKVLENLTLRQLCNPTDILIPKVDAKTQAQYFFSKTTVNEVILLITRLNVSKILCIGAPRIHEFILNNYKNKIKSKLLDIEKNYYNFYSKDEFIWFNMFNNYVFDPNQRGVLEKFLSSGRVLILLDPPFGGRVEPLAHTLKEISKSVRNSAEETQKNGESIMDTFWFFPYFMEQHIRSSLPNFKMFDYKVNYENHSSFTDSGKRKRKFGSPVRIFTNVPLSRLDLNGISGYKLCRMCDRWVSSENRHCEKCDTCTSKDGRTYRHCSYCSKCVKPTYLHCGNCKRCCLPDHVCGQFQPDLNCYHCHEAGHKKTDCLKLKKSGNCEVESESIVRRAKKKRGMRYEN